MDDLISRQAAIDALKGLPTWWADGGGYYGGAQPPMVALLDPEDAVSAIENLPSEQPERKMGKWKTALLDHEAFGIRPKVLYCSECNQCIAYPTRYCPNCGADMRGEQDD